MSWTEYGVDVDPGPHQFLNFKTILRGISSGLAAAQIEKFDFIGFDACLMASIEMLPLMVPYTKYYIASEDLEPGHGKSCCSPFLAHRFQVSLTMAFAGWNYAYLDKLRSEKYPTALQISEVLWESFFNDGDDLPLTLARFDLTKVSVFVEAVNALAALLGKELSTPGIVLAFLQAAADAYRMGKEFVDFADFLSVLKERLPRALRFSDYETFTAQIDTIAAAMAGLLVRERHSEDVPRATGLNVYMPATE